MSETTDPKAEAAAERSAATLEAAIARATTDPSPPDEG
jgi:hypothetical protein